MLENIAQILALAVAIAGAVGLAFVAHLIHGAKRRRDRERATAEDRRRRDAPDRHRLRPALRRSNSREILEGLPSGSLIRISRRPGNRQRSYPRLAVFLELEPGGQRMILQSMNPLARRFRRAVTDLCFVERVAPSAPPADEDLELEEDPPTVVYGETPGGASYRARFRGEPSAEDLDALETVADEAIDGLLGCSKVIEEDPEDLANRLAEPACIFCGCTESRACAGGCSWISLDPPICSSRRCVATHRDRRAAEELEEAGRELDEAIDHELELLEHALHPTPRSSL